MKKLIALAALAAAASTHAEDAFQARSPGEIVAAAPKDDWIAIAPDDLLVMTLPPDQQGNPREVIIQLMPSPFSEGWVHNIKLLARNGWYNGTSINRVQDNYVVQWGDPNYDNPEGDPTKVKPLPDGLKVMGEDLYVVSEEMFSAPGMAGDPISSAEAAAIEAEMAAMAAELERVMGDPSATEVDHDAAVIRFLEAAGLSKTEKLSASDKRAMISIAPTQTQYASHGWHERDGYTEWVEFWKGWPIGNKRTGRWLDEKDQEVPDPLVPSHVAEAKGLYFEADENWFWPLHCYGMVGVGRNYSPDTGSGAELYAVIGHAPRHLDRNIALVGRVIEGIEHLTSLPRGKGQYAFYADPTKRTPILTVRLSSEISEDERPDFEYLSTKSVGFAEYIAARANRRDPFFIQPAGGIDICNIPVPIRRVPAE